MSSPGVTNASDVRFGGREAPFRLFAVLSALVLTGSYVSILYHVADVVGGSGILLLVLAATVAASTALARFLGLRSALALGAVALVVGLVGYLASVPNAYVTAVTLKLLFDDVVALLTGLSVLRMTKVTVWVFGVAPGPVFLSWYLTLRRRYGLAALVGGTMLGFFVLTGDAGPIVTLVGVLGAIGTIAFGAMERRGGTWAQLDMLAIVLVAMVVVSMSVSVVPGGGTATPLTPTGRGDASTVESNLVNTNERVSIVGSIRLSPKVRFTVQSDRAAYWRTAAYDRYTGGDWVRTGDTREYRGSLNAPEGEFETVQQTFTARTGMSAMPAAWRPARVGSRIAERTLVTDMGDLRIQNRLRKGESYTVESRVPDVSAETLREAGTDYPDRIEERYLQLPESTPDRVGERTAEITAGASNPYDKAAAIEKWLEQNKRYSLEVERPNGDIADKFLFEMEKGYCVYYATTMATMLRTQGIPARFVTGYTPGQRVAENKWVVRGLDSHAWVEVYFEDVGWVRFDPTPGGPRASTEGSNVAQARAAGVEGVDTNGSAAGTWTPEPTTTPPGETPVVTTTPAEGSTPLGRNNLISRLGTPTTSPGLGETPTPTPTPTTTTEEPAVGWGPLPGPPSREQAVFSLLLLAGAVATAHRTGTLERGYRGLRLRFQGGRRAPVEDVERAYERLEYLLGRRYRERKPGETPRAYLSALRAAGADERAGRVGALYERAHYGGSIDREEADEAIDLVDAMVNEHGTLRGRLERRIRG